MAHNARINIQFGGTHFVRHPSTRNSEIETENGASYSTFCEKKEVKNTF